MSHQPGLSRAPAPGARAAAVAATAVAVALLSGLSIGRASPSLLAPYSLTVVIPYWVWGPEAALLIHPALFLASANGILRGRLRAPRGGALVFAVCALVSLGFTALGLGPGLRHYGALHTVGILAFNVTAVALLGRLLARALRRHSFAGLLAFHGLLWGWMAWSGLPWLRQLF